MSQSIIDAAVPVNPDALTACPRCQGTGRVRHERPGGWIIEPCSICNSSGAVDLDTAETVRTLQRHANAEAALGPVDGPCCSPEEGLDPCSACLLPDLFPDDTTWVPSEDDEQARLAWVRDYDERILSERIAADEEQAAREMRRSEADARLAAAVFAAVREPTFQGMLAALSDAFRDHETRADARWLGVKIGGLYDQARLLLDAKSGEQFDDRRDAMLDAIEWSKS